MSNDNYELVLTPFPFTAYVGDEAGAALDRLQKRLILEAPHYWEFTRLCMSIAETQGMGLILTQPNWVSRFNKSLGHYLQDEGLKLVTPEGVARPSVFDASVSGKRAG